MSCQPVRLSGGRTALVCGPRVRRPLRRCIVCYVPETMASIKLCDAPVSGKPGQTCNAVVCVDHAFHVEPDTDWCPQHAPLGP